MPDKWLIRDLRSVLERVDRVGLGFRAQNPRLLIIVFYDLHCPGCALLEDEAGDYLMELFRRVRHLFTSLITQYIEVLRSSTRFFDVSIGGIQRPFLRCSGDTMRLT
ncbi:hypothetical protein [Vulcanisaeta souniana]|uniref:hypothetical protein n=1 Tax=Vulcanisaeta souniana TaxID=164452 RepID=UPI0006D23463|nr:hypothetical protein [Vulcanisaeta souniana]